MHGDESTKAGTRRRGTAAGPGGRADAGESTGATHRRQAGNKVGTEWRHSLVSFPPDPAAPLAPGRSAPVPGTRAPKCRAKDACAAPPLPARAECRRLHELGQPSGPLLTVAEGERPSAGAAVLTHPAFDRPPVVNARRPGPKRGAVSLAAARRQRQAAAARYGAPGVAQGLRPASAVHDLRADLTAAPDCTPAERATIAAALGVLDARLRRPGAVLDSPRSARELLALHLAGRQTEGFGALFMDSQHAVIEFAVLFEGTLAQTVVHPRELVRRALLLNAAAVILAHNHPSGMPEPSRGDVLVTQAAKAALALVDVVVLDHVIVGRLSAVSMAERGMV